MRALARPAYRTRAGLGGRDRHPLREAELELLRISKDFIEPDSTMGTERCAPMPRHAEARSVVEPAELMAYVQKALGG